MKIILLSLLLLSCSMVWKSKDIEGWKYQDASSFSYQDITKGGNSEKFYKVSYKDGKIVVSETKWNLNLGDSLEIVIPRDFINTESTLKIALRVHDGWLIGFNNGEFGAEIRWYSNTGANWYKVSDHQVNQFFKMGTAIFAIEGLSHLSMSAGSLIKLVPGNNWTAESVYKFPDEPVCVTTQQNETYIITQSRIYKYLPTPIEIFKNGFWGHNQVNSCLEDKNHQIFMGMRSGVAEYALSEGKTYWLSP